MSRHGITAVVCAAAGALLLGLGALLPAHVRAVDGELLAAVGEGSPTMADLAGRLASEGHWGAARLLYGSARPTNAPSIVAGLERIREAVEGAGPGAAKWGRVEPWLDRHVGTTAAGSPDNAPAVLEWALPAESRAALLKPLSDSTQPAVMALVACRKLERTEIFPPVPTPAGQPLEAALLVAASLAELGHAHPGLAVEWERSANAALQGRGTSALERSMLDLLSASRRLDWDTLGTLTRRCEDAAALAGLHSVSGPEGRDWGSLMATVLANGGARGVAGHIRRHGETGLKDLREALSLGSAAVSELVASQGRIHSPRYRLLLVDALGLRSFSNWLNGLTRKGPQMALAVKYLLWIDGLFLTFLGAWHFRRVFMDPALRRIEPRPDLRVVTIAAVAGGVLLFLTVERYLVLQRAAPNARGAIWQPMVRARLRADLPKNLTKPMNEKMIAMLVAFFVIQLSIYLIGLARLRGVRNQDVEAPVKLRLIDNEEALFDAPLYMGIAGSVLALVLRLTGFEGISLMASYSSTLFGILFCFILKVMHVRPLRQQLILESAEYPPA